MLPAGNAAERHPKQINFLRFFSFIIGILAVTSVAGAQVAYPSKEPLIQQNNLTYLGAFRLPSVPYRGGFGAKYGFDYAGEGFAYNPAHNSLFINNHVYEQKTAEVSIPQLSADIKKLSTATFLQNFSDITEGHLSNILANGSSTGSPHMGGLIVYDEKLIGTSYEYYDANGDARLSHFTSGLTLSTQGDFQGMYKVGTGLNSGYYAGYMAQIPTEWQTLLGGPALTGQCCLSIIGRTSLGPSAFVFNPDDLGKINPVPATPLVYYSLTHPTLGDWSNRVVQNLYYNMGTAVAGAVFPAGTASVLFFGTQGTGVPCYGEGTSNKDLDRQPVSGTKGAVVYCYDPANSYKGNHSYPYKYWVWAYDANDFVSVKNGEKHPWDIRPYAIWELPIPWPMGGAGIQGVAYDSATQRIYVSQSGAEILVPGAGQYAYAPLIQVFKINNTTPILAPAPSPTPVLTSTPALVSIKVPPAKTSTGSSTSANQTHQQSVMATSTEPSTNSHGTQTQIGYRILNFIGGIIKRIVDFMKGLVS